MYDVIGIIIIIKCFTSKHKMHYDDKDVAVVVASLPDDIIMRFIGL